MKRALAPILLLLSAAAYAGAWEKISGPSSEIKEPLTVAIRAQGDWEALWKRHCGGAKPAPAADFARETIVAVFIGERRTAGVKVDLDPVADPQDASKLVVFYREVAPANDSISADVISYPFAIRKLAKTYKTVDFAINQRVKALQRGAVDARASGRMAGAVDHAWAFAQHPLFD